MALRIQTFANPDQSSGWRPGNNFGGSTLFKALGHPKTAAAGRALAAKLRTLGRVAVYDPDPKTPAAEPFDDFFGLAQCDIAGVYVQRVEDVGRERLSRVTRPITDLKPGSADALFIAAFDAQPLVQQLGPYLPPGMTVLSLDDMRLPDVWLGNRAHYLDPLNFATNFALLTDAGGRHSRVATANYWARYGAADADLWLCLFGGDGEVLAEWDETLPGPLATIAIDSRAVRQRFGLGEFTGSLFIHARRPKGHDVVKYALDFFSDDGAQLTCSHDANAWPADLYSGVPAAEPGERITLWVQNSHPVPIPPGGLGLNRVGRDDTVWYDREVPPFATHAVDLTALLPNARWPDQIEIRANRYFVRPRYEVRRADGRARIAHANVERIDLKPEPAIAKLGATLGKGYIMPLPVLPLDRFRTLTIPTPMAHTQSELPLKLALYDADGTLAAERYLGRLPRNACPPNDIDAFLRDAGTKLKAGFGHVEYLYDFRDGDGGADGWLHALGKYELRASGHMAETIFGAHIYNVPAIFRDEPQSYTHRPPGLTTRLYLRVGDAPLDTLCHLVYPASLPWHQTSTTVLTLHDGQARPIASRTVNIPCGGSLYWQVGEMFTAAERRAAGAGASVEIRDTTCRLFGFHGLLDGDNAFCLDHMFGF
jgi:hypothetical protein